MRSVQVGIRGLGTVGSGVFNVITRNLISINNRKLDINILQVGVVDNPNCDTTDDVVRDIFSRTKSQYRYCGRINGGTTVVTFGNTALNNNKHVVTANKALIATRHGDFHLTASKGLVVSMGCCCRRHTHYQSNARRSCCQPDKLGGWHY